MLTQDSCFGCRLCRGFPKGAVDNKVPKELHPTHALQKKKEKKRKRKKNKQNTPEVLRLTVKSHIDDHAVILSLLCLCLTRKQRTLTRLVSAKLSLHALFTHSLVISLPSLPLSRTCAAHSSLAPSPHPFTGSHSHSVLPATLPRLTDPPALRYPPAQVEAQSRCSAPRRFYQIC